MRRSDLLRQLEQVAADADGTFAFHREGGNHEIWKANGKSIPIPRHREVNDYTAQKIISQVQDALG